MQVWWCAALCVCARLAGGERAAQLDAGAFSAPEGEDLSPGMLQEPIEMEQDAADDPMLASLRAAGRAGAALCAGDTRCAGALWARRWLLARASCARAAPLELAAVLPLRPVASCGNITPESGAIGVLASFVHPLHAPGERAYDAALLLLARAAPVPPHANRTRALLLVPELARWLEYIPAALPAAWARTPAMARPGAAPRPAGSPLRLLAAAVLMPAAALLLLFALALRLPGADAIRYDLLQHDAVEHAPEPDAPSDDADEKPETMDDAQTADRLDFL